MGELIAAGRVRSAGLAAFAKRSEKKSGIYAYEQRHGAALDNASEKLFHADQAAWRYLQAEAPWYRRTPTYWVMSARREETRKKRLGELIAASAAARRIRQLIPPKPRSSR